jgi:cytochrome d ubiquinol oxidase subunit I
MLALAWFGSIQIGRQRLERQRWLLWALFLSFPLGFVATLTGWFTAEVGRQPWTVYGQLRTADAATPFLSTAQVATTLIVFVVVYSIIFSAGVVYIYRLLRREPAAPLPEWLDGTNPKRPLAMAGDTLEGNGSGALPAGEGRP